MKTYRVMNRVTLQWWEGEASSAQEACQKAGWMIGDCWVREYVPPHQDESKQSGWHYGGWRKPREEKGNES